MMLYDYDVSHPGYLWTLYDASHPGSHADSGQYWSQCPLRPVDWRFGHVVEFDWASIEPEIVKVLGLLSEGCKVAVHISGCDTAGFALVLYVFLRHLHDKEQASQVLSNIHPHLAVFDQAKAEFYTSQLLAKVALQPHQTDSEAASAEA